MSKLRHQLAAYSPIPPTAVLAGGVAALGMGNDPREALEELLRREYDAEEVMLCGSGTQALQLAITIVRQELGDDALVALPAFSCFDVASAALGAGGRVALYDLDPRTLGPELESFERVLAAGARIVVVAPLYGIPVNWEALEERAARTGAVLIEDAAQGHGASWRGRRLGTLGSISTLSFGRGKGWTGGHGGAVLVRGGRSLDRSGLSLGRRGEMGAVLGLAAQWALGRPEVYGLPRSIPALRLGETTYHPPVTPTAIGRSAASAVLRSRRESLLEAARRRENAQLMLARLGGVSGVQTIAQVPASEGEGGFLRFPLRIAERELREQVLLRGAHLGVAPSYPIPLAQLAPLGGALMQPLGEWPGAETLARELVTLPTHSLVSRREREELLTLAREHRPSARDTNSR